MKTYLRLLVFVLLTVAVSPTLLHAEDATDIVRKSQEAFFSQGKDMQARVKMKLLSKSGQQRLRELTMLRKNGSNGEQKYFMYFHNPGDVRGTSFMVYKYPGKDDDRWIFIPAINLVNRIAAKDSRSSFVGSDFTYEDVSGRDVEDDTHKYLREESIQGKPCYVVESIPKNPTEYTKKLSWVDKATYLPLKDEYYDVQGSLYKVFTADKIEIIGGLPAVTGRTMSNVKNGHKTEVVFENTAFNVGIADDVFSERYLRKPSEKWIK
ncbi:MAG: outer membrane lipoprotein-sorting protein [Nitrospirae bacterium]|nr:outer membrane lipoprotein-sorting protein [Nitrospirota bacterium]